MVHGPTQMIRDTGISIPEGRAKLIHEDLQDLYKNFREIYNLLVTAARDGSRITESGAFAELRKRRLIRENGELSEQVSAAAITASKHGGFENPFEPAEG